MENVKYFENVLRCCTNNYQRMQVEKHIKQLTTPLEQKEKDIGEVINMDNDKYHWSYSYSASRIKNALKSTAEFFKVEEKPKTSPAFDYGNALEMMLLELPKWEQGLKDGTIVVMDYGNRPEPTKTMASKLNKEWEQDLKSKAKLIISLEEYNEIARLVAVANEHPEYAKIKGSMQVQKSFFWIDDQTDLLLQTRPDIINIVNDIAIVTDVKTTVDGSPDGFGKQFAQLNYGIQAAMQVDGIEAATGKKVAIYTYMVFEKGSSNVQFYELSLEEIDFYRRIYKECVLNIRKALDDPKRIRLGYSEAFNKPSILKLDIPVWHKKQLENKFNI